MPHFSPIFYPHRISSLIPFHFLCVSPPTYHFRLLPLRIIWHMGSVSAAQEECRFGVAGIQNDVISNISACSGFNGMARTPRRSSDYFCVVYHLFSTIWFTQSAFKHSCCVRWSYVSAIDIAHVAMTPFFNGFSEERLSWRQKGAGWMSI